MEIHPFDELKRVHRQATFIGMAMISSLIIYVIIVEFMKIDTKGMTAPVIVEIRFVNIFAKMLQNPLPCACLPVGRGEVLYPVRKAAGCPVRNFSLLTRSSFLEFTSNGASSGDDGLPYGSEQGFNAPCEPSRYRAKDLLTGFTFCFTEVKISYVLYGGMERTGREEVPWSL